MTSLIRSPHLGSNVARISLLRNKLITHRPHYSASGDTSPSEDHARVRQYARSILSQKIGILKLISSEDYNRKSDRSSSVGGHMRHSLDHFDSVLGVREDNSVLDYDSRNRNTDVERFEDAALLKCMNLLSRLTTLTSDLPVQVKFISDPSTGKGVRVLCIFSLCYTVMIGVSRFCLTDVIDETNARTIRIENVIFGSTIC